MNIEKSRLISEAAPHLNASLGTINGNEFAAIGAIRAGQAQQPSSLARGIGGAASGALAGAQLGSVVPGIGTAAGAIGGGLIGLVGGLGF